MQETNHSEDTMKPFVIETKSRPERLAINVTIAEPIHKQLRDYCYSHNMTIAAVVREMIAHCLHEANQ